mmetsp:Transcript_55554/g.172151  ORF Transcript_55554/g.172151 Transcript_55554/m.172151 type:complete len:104 (-) Transcript_55554:19-330(-)
MWNAVSGLSAAMTLAPACVPDLVELLDRAKPFPAMSLHWSALWIASSGISGIFVAVSFGEPVCARRFFWLSVLLCVDSVFFGLAFWLGEGGGVVGLLRGRGVR